jgi:GNAT superfamily N-acetyltransferase
MAKYNLIGGKSKGKTLAEIAQLHGMTEKELKPQFQKGTKHELEHTNNVIVARQIALDHLVEFPDYYDRLDKIEKMKKGAVVETRATLNDIVLYYERKGNWLFAKGNFYAWLYAESGAGGKVESGEYDFIMFPPMGKGSPFSDRYVPPLLMVWQKTYQKNYKGSEHLLGIVKGFYDEDKNQLIIEMMTTNPKFRRKGVNAHIIKQLRDEFGVSQEDVIFDKPTKEGKLFESSKKYHLGGDMSKHLAPNGKPSNLTHEQWHLVRTPEFKAWFGFWDLYAYGKAKEYYEPSVRKIAKELKEEKLSAIEEVANFLSSQVTENDVLIPMPSRVGVSTDTKKLAEKISEKTGAKIFDCLIGRKRESIYELKKINEDVSHFGFEFEINCEIPKANNYFIVDNVIGTGVTMKNALKLVMDKVGDNVNPLVYAIDLKHISKVVDENGEPLVVWHGTWVENPFDVFDFDKADLGFHFGTYQQAKNRVETKMSILHRGRKPIIKPYFLNIKTLFDASDIGEWQYPQRYIDMIVDGNIITENEAKTNGFFTAYYPNDNKTIRDFIINKHGGDVGFVYENKYEAGGQSYIVLQESQIKLADGTNTTFDGNNPDIRFANGGVMSYREYVDTQFDEEEDRYLPSGYLREFEIQSDKKDLYPILYRSKNGFEYRIKSNTNSDIGVFDGDKMIGYADSKAIIVAPLYQKKGIGLELVTILKERNPDHRFGSMTPEGWNLLGKYYDEKIAKKSNSTFENGGEIDETAQMYIDIISMNPTLEKYQKYKDILKREYDIDFDSIYKDNEYIENANLQDIKSQSDFLDFDNWLKYAKKISMMRGFVRMDYYMMAFKYDVTDDVWKKMSALLDFRIEKVEYIETTGSGDIARVMGNTIYYTEHADLYYLLHEIGHIYDFQNNVNGIIHNPAYSPTHYGTMNGGETFAENFAIYFINPTALKNWNEEVYDEMEKTINAKYEVELTSLVSEYLSDGIRFGKGGTLDFSSSKSLSIKIDNDIYKIQYQKDELGSESNPSEKKVWFAKVISKNGKQVEGRLCYADDYVAVIYGFNLDEIKDGIMYYYQSNDLYLILQDESGKVIETTHIENDNSDIRFDNGGVNLTNKELMANDFVNEQKELQRNSKYAILLDASWSNYTNEMREVYRDLQDEITKKLGYNPLVNYSPLSDNVILTFDDDSNLLGALEFTIEPQYTEVPRYSPSYIKPEPIFENNNNVFFIEYIFSFAKGNGQKIMNKLKQYAHKYNVDIGLYGSIVYREDQDKSMASAKHLQRFYDKQGFINVMGHYFLYSPNSMAKGGRTIAQTPAPKSDRVYGSKTNPKGSASDSELAKSIKFNDNLEKAIDNKVIKYNDEHPMDKVRIQTAKAVVRRGMGAYSKSHRPTISGGAPNSRQAWGLARLNKFLLKKSGVKVKSAYIQDDDLLKYAKGGQLQADIKANAYLKPSNCTDVADVEYAFDVLRELDAKYGEDNPTLLKLWAKMLERKKYLLSKSERE